MTSPVGTPPAGPQSAQEAQLILHLEGDGSVPEHIRAATEGQPRDGTGLHGASPEARLSP